MKVRRLKKETNPRMPKTRCRGFAGFGAAVMIRSIFVCLGLSVNADTMKTDVYVSGAALGTSVDLCWSGATIADTSDGYIVPPASASWSQAMNCWEHSAWRPNILSKTWGTQLLSTAPVADFIWKSYQITSEEANNGDFVFFKRQILIPEQTNSFTADLYIMTADNAYYFYVNDEDWKGVNYMSAGIIGANTPTSIWQDNGVRLVPKTGTIDASSGWYTAEMWTVNVASLLHPGENWLQIVGINAPYSGGPTANPGSIVYKLVITYEDPVVAGIDVKPGSWPNSICLNDQGLLPVAILGSADLDVKQIDPTTVNIDGTYLAARGSAKQNKLAFSYEDVNGDGYCDLMVFFNVPTLVAAGTLAADTISLNINAYFIVGGLDGQRITGSDEVRIVPP